MYLAWNAGELFPGSSFAVAHCNFHLRGAESDGDEAFVREWCASQGLPLYVRSFDTSAFATEQGVSVEMAARQLRYTWFSALCAEGDFDGVAVAHNAEDDAETMMLNLLRGTGTRGLCGMASAGPIPYGQGSAQLFRPLLGLSRTRIRAWMEEHGKAWREDSTNAGTEIKRNLLRHKVFPVFGQINPSFLETLRRDRSHLAQTDAIAEDYYQSALPSIQDACGRIDLGKLLGFKHWCYLLFRLTEGMDEATLGRLCDLLASGHFTGTRQFGGWTLSQSFLEPAGHEPAAPAVIWEILPREAVPTLPQPAGTLVLDAGYFDGAPVIRPWKAGDWMVPLGMKGRKKLSDLFADLKFSAADKARARVIEYPGQPGRVAALAGYRIDDSLKVTGETERVMKITLE